MTCPTGTGKSEPTITVAIVAYQSGPTLDRCLAGLAAQTFTDFEILLVDNASTDGAPQRAAAANPAIRLISPGDNLGFAAGNNLAAREARGRWLALLNPDAYPRADWLENMVSAADRYPHIHSFTSRQLMAENPSLLDGLGDVMSGVGVPYRGGYSRPDPGDLPTGEVFSPCGAAMLIDRSLFLAMGGFDESFFCYCEDVDLGYRLRLRNEATLVVPDAVVLHEGSVSSGGPRSEFAVFHGTRNRLWLLIKNTPLLLTPIVLPLHFLVVAIIMTRKFGRLQARVTIRALLAALSNLGPVLISRRKVQKARTASTWAIASAMTWNLNDVRRARTVIRKPKAPRSAGA
ncbi:glycosyltransferase family 2 protein [Caulobacter sp. Root1472]|uniref:glycosyltransferase family 2 protein n=1 Tax=Caulobacter sp. Root1472 TaxID=1736470 RepID=UPI0006FC3D24|nr:glycosyltransferase family 2 protein [Caulobacter sp. Root1472]KQZ29849.1 glycosyl transferase [Caulobacter sp. Root1472]